MKPALRRAALRFGVYGPLKGTLDSIWLRCRRRTGTYSQFGEDIEVLARLGTAGLYADIGANHPFKTNNTYLLYLSGWRGLAMEPIKSLSAHHRAVRPGDVCLNAAAGRTRGSGMFHELSPTGYSTFDAQAAASLVADRRAVSRQQYEVPIVPLADAWHDAFGSRRPDFVSIDTEGFESEVLAGADLARLRPRLVLLELRSAIESGRGSALVDVMADAGYKPVAEFGVNGMFERIDENPTSASSPSDD